MVTYFYNEIEERIAKLDKKRDTMETVRYLINDIDMFVYDKTYEKDEDGEMLRDEDGNYIQKKTECEKNEILDDVIQYILKKYA